MVKIRSARTVIRQTYPTGFALNYTYSAAGSGKAPGVLERVADAADATRIFWRIDDIAAANVFNARGSLLRANLGNGLGTDHEIDTLSGKAFALRTGTAGGGYANALSLKYEYDLADNVKRREDVVKAITETYSYDRLNRLADHSVASGEAAANRSVSLAYNAIGNVLTKSDVGGYAYQPTRPHAVAQANGLSYAYDANGSLLEVRAPGTSGSDARVRQIDWTAFNQPASTSYLGKTVAFTHDQDHRRIREVATDGSRQRTLDLLHPDNKGGLAYEREETRVNGTLTSTENRHYVSVAGTVVAVVKTNDDAATIVNSTRIQYWHKDALGSVVAVSDGTGAVVEQMAYDAWGRRTRSTGLADPAVDPSSGDRGFTGHEHLDEVQLVHMNGRVYDPLLAKFLSVDPVVGDPNDLQTYNRYSYVYNQPTRYADATGECPWCPFAFLVAAIMANEGNKYWSVIGRIGMIATAPGTVAEFGMGSFATVGTVANSATAGALAAVASPGASLESVVTSAVFAAAFTDVGSWSKTLTPQQLIAHMVLGCAQQAVSGGKCGPGAIAAGFAKIASGQLPPGLDNVSRGAMVAVIGGTASVIGGGKFGNGAVQAGFGYVFNFLTNVHKDLTMRAARDAGLSSKDTLELSVAVKNADFVDGTQDPKNAHQHAMCTDSNAAACRAAFDKFLSEQWNSKTLAGFARFLHAWQDQYAGGHGFRVWDGGNAVGLPDREHIKGDLYPAPDLARRIVAESAALIRAYRTFCSDCFKTSKP